MTMQMTALFRPVVLLAVATTALLVAQEPARHPARDYRIRPVPFYDVTVDDGFWAPRIDRNRSVSIPHIMRENERTGRVANFEKAAGLKQGDYQGRRFNDSDVYKTIEAASYALKARPDAALESQIAHLVDLIARTQAADGYLYPARTLGAKPPVPGIGADRWVNLNGSHELYNVGHLYEAAIAWRLATGRDDLMQVAVKNANLVDRVFGPSARKAVPGHEEIELALVKMFRTTGDGGTSPSRGSSWTSAAGPTTRCRIPRIRRSPSTTTAPTCRTTRPLSISRAPSGTPSGPCISTRR